jgi:hypothetical protein
MRKKGKIEHVYHVVDNLSVARKFRPKQLAVARVGTFT